MGRNIFVSYKYADSDVAPINGEQTSTARSYVNALESLLDENGHAYYGEKDDEDLSDLTDNQIYETLKDRIFPTSCTIVLISPNMREEGKSDRNQWIPWEVYYSLRETTRSDYTSRRNAVLAVVLPDKDGNYGYTMLNKNCCTNFCTSYLIDGFFSILKNNMFNIKKGVNYKCSQNDIVWNPGSSYIHMVRWKDFVRNITRYIEIAESIKDRAEDYDLYISVN